MTTYTGPTENLRDFNSSVFKSANESTLTLGQAKALFLGRTGNPTSTAISTSFTGGDLLIGGARFGLGGGRIASNIAVGNSSLNGNTTGTSNVGVGTNTLVANTGGSRNVAVGFEAFKTGTIYNNSIALGASTVVAGNQAVAIGYLATASDSQIVLGTAAETVLCKGTTGNGSLIASRDIYVNNVRVGLGNGSVSTNTQFGNTSMTAVTGGNNCAFGQSALEAITSGNLNCAFGVGAFKTATTGVKNTCIGYLAGSTIGTNSNDNTMIGNIAGTNINGVSSQNTFVGSQSGRSSLSTVQNATALGFQSRCDYGSSTVIGIGATATAANQIVLGRSTEFVECAGTDATNGSLKLNGGLQLQTTYNTPTSTMLGYTITGPASTAITLDNTGLIGNLYSFEVPLGVWIILFQINLVSTNNLTITFMNQCLALAVDSTVSFQITGGQFIRNLTEVFPNVDITSTPGTATVSNYTTPFTLFLNISAKYTGAGNLTASGTYTLTRIG